MRQHRHRLLALLLTLLAGTLPVGAQTVAHMVNGDTVRLDGCTLGGGTIFDDGGPTGNYSNSFDGWVEIQVSAGVSITLSGTYQTETCCDRLWVYDGATVLLDGMGGTGTVNATATSGLLRIRFQTDYSSTYSGLVLTWSLSGVGSGCANPVSGLDTTAVSTNSIGLTWSATNPAGPFNILVDGALAGTATTTSYTLTGLNASTEYNISVIATASASNQCCGGHLSVRTDCGEIFLPYSEGFEQTAEHDFPPCWLSSTNFDDENYLPQVVTTQHHSGSQSLMLSCGNNNTAEHYGMVATPPIGGTGERVMYVYMRASQSNTPVMVGLCDSTGTEYNSYGFTQLQTLYINTEWTAYRIEWTATAGGKRLAFRMLQSMQNNVTGRIVYIDGMSAEVCGVDSLATSQMDYNRLTLSWSTFGSPDCTVGVRPIGSATDSVTYPGATSPLNITGLGAERTYVITVYPSCNGHAAVSRSITVTMPVMPANAERYCSNFRESYPAIPTNWTFNAVGSAYYSINDMGIYINCGSSSATGTQYVYLSTERLVNLAGKRVVLQYSASSSNVPIEIGSLRYADDPTTFESYGSFYTISDGNRHTVMADIPDSVTAGCLAIGFRYGRYYSFTVHAVEIGYPDCVVGHEYVVHRRGTNVQLDWGAIYDTVLVQSGVRGFTLGTGQVDTFYHARRGTVRGLAANTEHDFYIYRPCGQPCLDRQITARTATRDYPIPYCEDFTSVTTDSWYSGSGDWIAALSTNDCPRFNNGSLELTSWGFSNGYYTTVELPDAETDSNSMLSFYISTTAPTAFLIVGTIAEGYSNSYFRTLDTIQITSSARTHYYYRFRPSDTLFDGRIALRFMHQYEYLFYRAYIDEMHIAHTAYERTQLLDVSYDTATLAVSALVNADSVDITLAGGGGTTTQRVAAADIASIGFGNLQPGTGYNVYVTPLDGGCQSYAFSFWTLADGSSGSGGGDGYEGCYTMDNVLSDELPRHWAATGSHNVTLDNRLEIAAGTALALYPGSAIGGRTFLIDAKSTAEHDTLLLGVYSPSDTISNTSTLFVFDASLFTPIDTFEIDTAWRNFSITLPTPATEGRLCLKAGQGILQLDNIGITACPLIVFEVEGNVITCKMAAGTPSRYTLILEDSAGMDVRHLQIDEDNFKIMGLRFNTPYTMTVLCNSTCQQTTVVRTENTVPLPYCEYFNQYNSSISVPSTWTIIKSTPSATVAPTTYPSLNFTPGSGTIYAVLPRFKADSAMSLFLSYNRYGNYIYDSQVQVGTMTSETDTASFVPLYSSELAYLPGSQTATVDLSSHTDKYIALRFSQYTTRLMSIRVYGIPIASYKLVHAGTLKAITPNQHPYWLHAYNGSYYDTMAYITENPHDIDFGRSYIYLNQATDSTGYTCETGQYLDLGTSTNIPFCWNSGLSYCFTYGNGSVYYNYVIGEGYRYTLQGNKWMVMPEINTQSIQDVAMKMVYRADNNTDSVVVGVMTDAYDTLSFTPVDTITYTQSPGFQQTAIIDFSSYADSGRWVALHHLRNNTDNGQLYLSGIYGDTCVSAISATATLKRWNRVQIDAQAVPFYIEYFAAGTSYQGAVGNTILRIDSVPATLILAPETTYDFYFRCDSLGTTCRPVQKVKTLAAPVEVPSCIDFDTANTGTILKGWTRFDNSIVVSDTIAHSGAKSMKMPIGTNTYIITPDVNVSDMRKVAMSVWYYAANASDRLVVGVMSDPNDLSTFHPIRTLAPGVAGVWQRGLVEFSSAPDASYFIAFRARSNNRQSARSIYVDDIYIDTSIAFDLRVKDITSNAITLDWKAQGSANVTVTVMDGDTVAAVHTNATPPLLIEPLNILHYYTFLFQSICGTEEGYCNTSFRDTLSVITPAPGVGCVNATDLNSPQAVFFTGRYDNPYMEAGAVNYGSQHPDSRHTVCYDTAQRDPRTGNQLRTIPEGYTSSVRLGNWSTNYYSPEAEGVIYSLYVDTSSFELLLLRYAAVLQDPIHAPADQPRFRMELLDTNYNIIDSACTSADFIADQNLGWNTAPDGVLWKDWTAVGIDLSAHAGEQVYFRLTTFDCNEGSHYGYAYFTLECMRKNMNTVSCGDVDSNTLSAPEGFHYRWYTSQSPTTISTAQNIRVPSEDITYYCEVSKLDNASCQFLISAYAGTRYPIADFDTAMVIDSCRFYVTFTNTGGVSNDKVTLIPGERCETTLWDFGNGKVSTNYNGYTVYTQPGTYTVRLISGIALNACQDTMEMTLTLNIPKGMAPSDTTDASICDNQTYTFFGQSYNTASTYYHNVPLEGNPCDSIYVLQLDVRATSVGDTTALACDSIFWHGNAYTTDGIYTDSTVGPNSVACDSTIRLTLTVKPTFDTVDTITICPYRPYVYEGVDYGGPVTFDTTLYTEYACDSVVHVTLQPRDSNYRLTIYYAFDSNALQPADTLIPGCASTTLLMVDSTAGATQWLWNLFAPDTTFTTTIPTFSYTLREDASDSVQAFISLVTQDTQGCFDTVGWPVFVFPSPNPDFRWEPYRPSISKPEVQFYNLSTPLQEQMDTNHSIDYLWRIQTVEGGDFDTTSVFDPFYHWGSEGDNMAGDYTVRLLSHWMHHADSIAIADFDWVDSTLFPQLLYPAFYHTCTDSAEQTVTITNEYLQFPNLVTPNGDGINDRWEVMNLVEFGNYSMNELWIYDRTGALVYHVRNIRRADQFWDPEATRSPDGTYFYRFVAEGEYGVVKRNGSIEVLRK